MHPLAISSTFSPSLGTGTSLTVPAAESTWVPQPAMLEPSQLDAERGAIGGTPFSVVFFSSSWCSGFSNIDLT